MRKMVDLDISILCSKIFVASLSFIFMGLFNEMMHYLGLVYTINSYALL